MAACVLGAASIFLAAAVDADFADRYACVLAAVSAILSGVLVLRAVRLREREYFGTVLGWGTVVWGLLQLIAVLARDRRPMVDLPPEVGTALAVASPLAVATGMALPWIFDQHLDGARLAFEAVMVGAAFEALAWQLLIHPAAASHHVAWITLAATGARLVAMAFLAIRAAADRDPWAGWGAFLLGLFVLVDLATGRGGVMFHSWNTAVIAVLAWPIAVVGLYLTSLRRQSMENDPSREWRRSTVATLGVALPTIAVGWLTARSGEIDLVLVWLLTCVLTGFLAREVIRSKQTRDLLELTVAQALSDPLTGMGNRRALTTDLERLTPRNGTIALTDVDPPAVLVLDIDGFKEINAQYGHSRGDAVLLAVRDAVAERLTAIPATWYRLGGDEFAVITDDARADECALLLREAVTAGVTRVPGMAKVALTGSVGIAVLDGRLADPLGAAGEALRVAKEHRNEVQRYDESIAARAQRRIELERRLRMAVAKRTVQTHFQPVVDLTDERVVGFEALARWHDELLGDVSPDEFIPVAEQAGLINRLGQLAMEHALGLARMLADVGRPMRVAVNISPLQLNNQAFPDDVDALLGRSGVDPANLLLELTEGTFLDPTGDSVLVLRQLARRGVGVALDDFGSGYSSLGYMSRLPVDVVKIDRSLTGKVHEPRTRVVVTGIMAMCAALGLEVVVEGVETREVAEIVRAVGADRGQGWFWSTALTAEQALSVVLEPGHLGAGAVEE